MAMSSSASGPIRSAKSAQHNNNLFKRKDDAQRIQHFLCASYAFAAARRIHIAALVVCVLVWAGCGSAVQPSEPSGVAARDESSNGVAAAAQDSPIGRAFKNRTSNVQVEDEGVVTRILEDDLAGSRHQRFIVRLASGQTILIVHNIDIAPRVAGLREGDRVRFYGEYVWNEKGGMVHWTHHDPAGRHVTGWLKCKGRTYQ